MQFTLLAAALAVFATGAIADNCKPGLFYCGSTLVSKGKYQAQIDQAIHDAGQQEIDNGKDDLFYCVGGNQGVIDWQKRCAGGCIDAGTDKSDHC
ncbi:hypothetical protein V499_03468 [Pseudogymnoascus sp. VKM F-103]|uniref:Killer toxin Kp4 domain-containing protein n=1 Tax=Pseudogymnoascus verrucosus TaxID=342668 RepID=A0A1B8GB35_9PEZI|nr:uncharacterized protein VE01_09003 [Pseudogymnoascus verrucosus]KFY77063.1 hypothetical protein V499_03468 [Pseudogymnoascus sp. VKM F-103]OBT93044.1 hypothetical protein VE01_09003 [Pseudogymnoascus verrucosus]